MSNIRIPRAAVFALIPFISSGCGPGEVPRDCVSVDEQLGTPPDRLWCEGEVKAPDWEGQPSAKELPICLPPLADGSCELCPSAKVVAEVETELQSHLQEYRPMCQLEHWELGCMWTIENAITIGYETDYCCFQVALWGPFCADQP